MLAYHGDWCGVDLQPSAYLFLAFLVTLRPVSSVSMDTQKQMCNVYRGEWLDGMRHGQVREPPNRE